MEEALERRRLCQIWNYTPEELDRADARRLLHDTALLDLFDAEVRRKAGK